MKHLKGFLRPKKKSLDLNQKERVGGLNPNMQVFSGPWVNAAVCHGFGVWLISRKDNAYLPPSSSGGLHFGSPLVHFI